MFSHPPEPATDLARTAVCELDGFSPPNTLLRQMSGGSLFLLESAAPTSSLSRWSMLGSHPVGRFVSQDGLNRFHWHTRGWNFQWPEEPLSALRQVLAAFPPVENPEGLPFCGGMVGFFSYELGRRLMPLTPLTQDDLQLPDISLFIYDRCLLFDHQQRRMIAVAWARGATAEEAELEAQAKANLLAEDIVSRLGKIKPLPDSAMIRKDTSPSTCSLTCTNPLPNTDTISSTAPHPGGDSLPCSITIPETEYQKAVDRCREEIRDGNAYELCLTGRFETTFTGDPTALYLALRHDNPAPFATFIRHPEATLIGSSPERFLKVDPGGNVEARPIKGTRPRGSDPESDRLQQEELAGSAKDRAENVMIVDLLRNDLSRVSVPGTVKVPELCVIEQHPAVFQMVSTITGRLRPDCDRLDLLAASFPGGSMTGAPKIAAMNILEELEPKVRGYYSGCQGYLGFDGSMDLSIIIRSVQLVGRRAIVGAGGAVVYDSDPEQEWREALHKADAPLRALAEVQGYNGYRLVTDDDNGG
jgi:para-aminobenzoate synthetase component I